MESVQSMKISGAQREYLEAIYDISLRQPNVRTTDIALKLGISKPSVNKAVASLKAKGLVTHQPYGAVILTETGRVLGERSGRQNKMIKTFLITVLSLSEAEAEKEACSIGSSLSVNTVEKIRSYLGSTGCAAC